MLPLGKNFGIALPSCQTQRSYKTIDTTGDVNLTDQNFINYHAQQSCSKVMFSQASVSHSVHMAEGGVWQTPWADTPQADTPQPRSCWDTHTPLPNACWDTHPSCPVLAGIHTPPCPVHAGIHTPCTVHAGIHYPPPTHPGGRYASYWNAFLLYRYFETICRVGALPSPTPYTIMRVCVARRKNRGSALGTVFAIAVADPGFPQGGGANPWGAPAYDFAKISQKLHEIERIGTPP